MAAEAAQEAAEARGRGDDEGVAAAEAQVQACKAAAAMAREAREKAKQTRDALRAQQETERLRAEAEVCSFTHTARCNSSCVCGDVEVAGCVLMAAVSPYACVCVRWYRGRKLRQGGSRRRKRGEGRRSLKPVLQQKRFDYGNGKVFPTSKRSHCCD